MHTGQVIRYKMMLLLLRLLLHVKRLGMSTGGKRGSYNKYVQVSPQDEVTPSLWSPKMRVRKSETMRGSPFLRGTVGSHPRSSFALEMSGFLLCGSSSVLGRNSIRAFGSIVSWTTCMITRIYKSIGDNGKQDFPRCLDRELMRQGQPWMQKENRF